MTLSVEDQAREADELFDKELELCFHPMPLAPPFSTELYAFCERIEKEIGLNNGANALYWHLQPIFQTHMMKRRN